MESGKVLTEEQEKEARTKEEVRLEEKKVRQLCRVVDFACLVLSQQPMSLVEARALVQGVRSFALNLFPGKEETFDLIYGSRFRRILCERFRMS